MSKVKNGLSYGFTFFSVVLVHIMMLGVILLRGNYDKQTDIIPLAIAVIGLDIAYVIVLKFINQMTYTVDLMMLLILGMSIIFQSCFGKIGFNVKHYITAIAALIFSQIGFFICRNHTWLMKMKKWAYAVLGLLFIVILAFTGSRSMWINFGSFTIQPSEFMKPVFVIMAATSIIEQHKKKKILFFWISPELIALTVAALCIFALQWWCRDLGSLPTFAAVYICGVICRICYPRAKLDKKMIITIVVFFLIVAGIAAKVAPPYVQERLHANIWKDPQGTGYQQCQALIAIAAGGLFGKGPGNGILYTVAASDTDIVFSTICEEWGLIMALLTILMIVFMVTLSFINQPRSYFHTTLVMGTAAVFTMQMALNIFGSTNMIPFTGVTIPFISAGGSSMVTSGFLAGMLKAGQSPVFRNQSLFEPSGKEKREIREEIKREREMTKSDDRNTGEFPIPNPRTRNRRYVPPTGTVPRRRTINNGIPRPTPTVNPPRRPINPTPTSNPTPRTGSTGNRRSKPMGIFNY